MQEPDASVMDTSATPDLHPGVSKREPEPWGAVSPGAQGGHRIQELGGMVTLAPYP